MAHQLKTRFSNNQEPLYFYMMQYMFYLYQESAAYGSAAVEAPL